MLKRFFLAFAGSMAAIWLSGLLLFVLMIVMVASLAVSGASDETAKLEDHSVLFLDLSGTIDERPSTPSLADQIYSRGEAGQAMGLNEIVMAIDAAAKDKKIDGIYIKAQGASAGIATRFSIIEALRRFKDSGKWVVAYSDAYGQGDYLISTMADSIFLNPQGLVEITGLNATTMYFKNLFDKLGVEMQILKVGTYKSAVEPFMLDHMSDASREQQESYLNAIWTTMVNLISENRNVTAEQVNMWADSISYAWDAPRVKANRIVDGLKYEHQMDSLVAALSSHDKIEDINLLTPSQYVTLKKLPENTNEKTTIAVLYAVGDITDDGKGGISATEIVPTINDIIDDDDIDGLVLRVNSGGGSAFASEQIWEALERFKATGRPFYVSMGDVAASGGYYISCGADMIFAQPQTLTGSIGIFGMIPCVHGLVIDKLGVNLGTVSTNTGGVISIYEPMTPTQRSAMQKRIDNGYEVFTTRCADGRHMSLDSIKAIAEGRVWSGQQALEIGLIDDIGTLDDVISAMAAELDAKKYSVKVLPKLNSTLLERILAMQEDLAQNMLREQMGETYTIYRSVGYFTKMNPVQARMQPVEIR